MNLVQLEKAMAPAHVGSKPVGKEVFKTVFLNPDQVVYVEVRSPDRTTVMMANGKQFDVTGNIESIVQKLTAGTPADG